MEFNKLLLTVEEATKFIGTSRLTLEKRMMICPDFPMISIGSKKLVIKDKVLDWLVKHNHEDFGQ